MLLKGTIFVDPGYHLALFSSSAFLLPLLDRDPNYCVNRRFLTLYTTSTRQELLTSGVEFSFALRCCYLLNFS